MLKNLKSKFSLIVMLTIIIGILFRLALTGNGNFLFNMDSARDFVDVREIVELRQLRLIGPRTAIEGLFNGPFWYYLLAVPYVVSNGDPYSAIILGIILWAVGAYFLLKLVKKWGNFLILPVGSVWVASNYIVLASVYSFNPTPVMFLTPLFIYLLSKYLIQEKAIYIILAWILSGLFFNFEMNFGVFTPSIIITSIILARKVKLLKQKLFWVGAGCFISLLLPQAVFDLKHQFIISKAIMQHLSQNPTGDINFLYRLQIISESFYNTFLPTIMNNKVVVWIILGIAIPKIYGFFKKRNKDIVVVVSLVYIFIPFIGYLFLPVSVNPWHWGGEMAASLVLLAYILSRLIKGGFFGRLAGYSLSLALILFGVLNIGNFFAHDLGKPSLDPAVYRNEIAAIDYVYKQANGKNFKAYIYLPSVYDYPYQYLFWWYGRKKYGYLPMDYAYAPDKPLYIPAKDKFSASFNGLKAREDSNLVFLIKEPDRQYTRPGWEGEFVKLESINKEKVGPLEIETRKEL